MDHYWTNIRYRIHRSFFTQNQYISHEKTFIEEYHGHSIPQLMITENSADSER